MYNSPDKDLLLASEVNDVVTPLSLSLSRTIVTKIFIYNAMFFANKRTFEFHTVYNPIYIILSRVYL